MKQQIVAIIEPAHRDSALCAQSIKGLETGAARYGAEVIKVAAVEDMPDMKAGSAAVVVSLSAQWTAETVELLRRLGAKSILLGVLSEEYDDDDVSGPALNRYRLVQDMVGYFVHAGRKRLASVGNESHDINDMTRRDAFLDSVAACGLQVSEEDVFYGDQGVIDCIERFLASAHRYDGALCVNDFVAVELMARAKQQGICIPRDLYVAGSGDFRIGQITKPTLTTSTLDYQQMGTLAVEIWHLLSMNNALEKIRMFISYRIIVRDSTERHPPVMLLEPPRLNQRSLPVQVGTSQMTLKRFEEYLLRCDALDLRLLDQIALSKSIESIAASLYVSAGTVNYRLRNAYQMLEIEDKRSLTAFLQEYAYDSKADCLVKPDNPLTS